MQKEDSDFGQEARIEISSSLLSTQPTADGCSSRTNSTRQEDISLPKHNDSQIETNEHKTTANAVKVKPMHEPGASIQPTVDETKLLNRLSDLKDLSGGLKNDFLVLTLVLIMRDEKRPLIQAQLLDIILNSSARRLESLLKANLFLGILNDWLNKNLNKNQNVLVLVKLLKVFVELPMSKEDIREIRLKVKKLGSSSSNQEVKSEASHLFQLWEQKRKGPKEKKKEKPHIQIKVPKLENWSKRKAGKAMVATNPNVKKPKFKSGRQRSGPLSASKIIEKRERQELTALLKSSTAQQTSPLQKSTTSFLDKISPQAAEAVENFREMKKLEEFSKEKKNELVHTMQVAPKDPLFYTSQKVLLEELKQNEKLDQDHLKNTEALTATVQWKELHVVQMPPGDVIKAPLQSDEKEKEQARELLIPPCLSSDIFSPIEEHELKSTSVVACPISFFAEDPVQCQQHEESLEAAGVANPLYFKKA